MMTTPTVNLDDDKAAQARGRRTLLGLAALFFVPLALSFWLYYAGGWRPSSTTNKGELITPARLLENVPFTLPDGTTSARADLLRNKWTLLYVGVGRCAEDCRQALWTMRQTRQLLAVDMDRVQRVLIARSDCCDMDFLSQEHPGLEVVRADDPSTHDFKKKISGSLELRGDATVTQLDDNTFEVTSFAGANYTLTTTLKSGKRYSVPHLFNFSA